MTRFLAIIVLLTTGSIACAVDVDLPTAEEFSVSRVIERLARRAEPDLKGKSERLTQYVDFFRAELANDNRLFAFNVTPKAQPDGKVELQGYAEFPETRAALNGFLTALGFQVADKLESLPAESLGKQIFGLVQATHSVCYDRPGGRQRPENDCLLGEPVYLLREENGFYLAHSSEGYLGYVRSSDVARLDAAAFSKYLDGKRVRAKSNLKTDSIAVPAAARLKWLKTDGDNIVAALPNGAQVNLPADSCEIIREPAADVDAVVASSRQMLGTRYLWGGKTTEGIDCSGLVQFSYSAAGVHLPRDAYQQFYVGHLSATRWHTAGLRRGDTLYFLGTDGKIRHTALYLGDNRYIQAVLPVVRISSFDPDDPDYDRGRHRSFAFAKRPVD